MNCKKTFIKNSKIMKNSKEIAMNWIENNKKK